MTRAILIRHGKTSWNQSRRIQDGNDTVLDEEGEHQCRCLADRLKNEKIAAVYSSPMSRAMGTAQAIASAHRLEAIEEPEFREMNCGTLEGAETKDAGLRLQQLARGASSRHMDVDESDAMRRSIEQANYYNKSKAAKKPGIGRTAPLWKKLKSRR